MRVSLWKTRVTRLFATLMNPWGATKTMLKPNFLVPLQTFS
jgi:hypothetical protein